MLKKIAVLVLLSASAIYADVKLDLHVTITKNDRVTEIHKTVIAAEGVSVELNKTETYQAIGLVDNVTENGALVQLFISECKDGVCELISSSAFNVEWNQVAPLDLTNILGSDVHIECIATQAEANSN